MKKNRIELHGYQKEVSDTVLNHLLVEGNKRCIASLAPGMGKTIIAANISNEVMKIADNHDEYANILFACPKIDLTSQGREDFLNFLKPRRKNLRTLIMASSGKLRGIYDSGGFFSTITLDPNRLIAEIVENNNNHYHNVLFITHDSLLNKLNDLRGVRWDFAFYDEAHNLCSVDEDIHKSSLTDPDLDIFPHICMLTATPSSYEEVNRRGVTNPALLEESWKRAENSIGMDNPNRFGEVVVHKDWSQGVASGRLVPLQPYILDGKGAATVQNVKDAHNERWAEALDVLLEAWEKDKQIGNVEEPGLPRVMCATLKGFDEMTYFGGQQKLFDSNARIFGIHSGYPSKYVEYTAPGVYVKCENLYDILKCPEDDMILMQYRIIAEGTNIPAMTSMFFSRTYSNESELLQCVSRCGRSYELLTPSVSVRKRKGRLYFYRPYQDQSTGLIVDQMVDDIDRYVCNPTTFTKVIRYDRAIGVGNVIEIPRNPDVNPDDNMEVPLKISSYNFKRKKNAFRRKNP